MGNISVFYDSKKGVLKGDNVKHSTTSLLQSSYIYQQKIEEENLGKVIYEVEFHDNGVKEGDIGGLFFGISNIYPGTIGKEFYMTKGHKHLKSDTGEYYWGLKGTGKLLMVNMDGTYELEDVFEGSLHYIPGNTAHRLINVGEIKLSVGACWQSESEHDYDACYFPIRLIKKGDGEIGYVNYSS